MVELWPRAQSRQFPPRWLGAWTNHPKFESFLKYVCNPNGNVVNNVNQFMARAKDWHRAVFGNIGPKKRRTKARLDGIQKALSNKPNHYLENLEKDLILYYNYLIYAEKSLWAQRARVDNRLYKDLSTKYFHMSTKIKPSKKKI